MSDETQALAVRQPTIQDTLYLAVERGAGIDVVERLTKLKCDLDDRRAMEEFNENMRLCQADMQPVRTDCENTQTHSKYASYKALNNAIRPIYTKYGFSISFDTDTSPKGDDFIRVLAYVARGPYVRTYKADIPADGMGAKGNAVMTRTHAHGSAHKYGRRYLIGDIFDIITTEDDDDGNAASQRVDISEDVEWIKNASTIDELKKLYLQAKAKAKDDKHAIEQVNEAAKARKAELQ